MRIDEHRGFGWHFAIYFSDSFSIAKRVCLFAWSAERFGRSTGGFECCTGGACLCTRQLWRCTMEFERCTARFGQSLDRSCRCVIGLGQEAAGLWRCTAGVERATGFHGCCMTAFRFCTAALSSLTGLGSGNNLLSQR